MLLITACDTDHLVSTKIITTNKKLNANYPTQRNGEYRNKLSLILRIYKFIN